MGDSAAALWESELLRARQWLAASRKDKQLENERLFKCVKAQIGFKDHQKSLQNAAASDDEDDTALDFLGDVDVSDMSALLQAEAAKITAAPPVELVTPVETSMPSAGDLMKPLEMPSNLTSPMLKPKTKAVPMSLLDPKTATINVTASATLGDDASVNALMEELSVDVTHLHHSDTEEGKTEESTPPHLLKNFGGSNGVSSGATQTKKTGAGAEQSKYLQQVSSKSPQAPHKKTAEAPATTKPDDVGAEMLSWVSGYRDPEVIRRKENMRRKRKHTHRYGMTSEEEQRQAMLQVKQITHDSDSESEDDFSSDYSPAEDEEVPEPDEPEVVDLLSDDYLDSDEDKRPVKRNRKRLRQAEATTKKKKSRSRKPTVTRKVTQHDSPTDTTPPPGTVDEAQPSAAESEANRMPARTKSRPIEESDDEATGKSDHPIDLASSGDETGDSDKGGTPKTAGLMITTSYVGDRNTVESEVAKESTTLRLKIPKDFKSPHDRLQKEASLTKIQQKQVTQANAGDAVGDTFSEKVSSGSVVYRLAPQKDMADTVAVTMDDNADDADLSDAGTVDLEGKDLSLENENTNQEDVTATEKEAPLTNADDMPKRVDNIISDAQHSTGASDEDVSEAETEILDDEEPNTDDLGLNYSDDSDSGGISVSDSKIETGNQKDGAPTKKDGAKSEGKTTSESHDNGDFKEKQRSDKKEDKVDASKAGVQQFFDFTPLKLKPKAKTTTSTAPKPLPVHNYDETHVKKGNNDAGRSRAEHKKSSVTPTKPPVGSIGLRSSKKTIATMTTMKGKHAVTRRSTKMLNPEDVPGAKQHQKKHYTMVPTQKYNKNTSKDLDDVPLAILAKETSKTTDNKPSGRYLAYAGAKKTEDAPTFAAETPRIVPKSRFGGGGGLNSAVQDFTVVSNGQPLQVNSKNAPQDGYRREPQMSIYDALHMEGQESASDIRDGAGFKRPSRFKKMQEEAARNGTPMVKSRLQDIDWDKVPIPKKKKQALQVEKSTQNGVLPTPLKASDYGSKNASGMASNKRRKKNSGLSNKNSGPSYYGPQTTSGKYDSPSRVRRGREHTSNRRDDSRKRRRSLSPPPRDRNRYDRRDDRRRRGSSRSRSRSPSPRSRDYSNSRHRRRSRSRSWSRERSSERDYRRSEHSALNSRDRDQQANGSRESRSPNNQDFSEKIEPPELGEVCQNGKIGDTDKQKAWHYSKAPPSPGALAPFDDDGDNMFVSDSDDDGNGLTKEVEDIRFDLDSVPVDESLLARQVYVTGFNPTVCAEQIEDDFACFGVAVDRDTRFPAIDIFPCQRNHLGRGDACVTFETEEGAQEAVEELNSKNVKNSMIRVRLMDAHTQRILTVQFQMVRDTWKCTGTQCRAEVSIWNAKCDKCGRKRVYGPSNIKIGAESWLCSLCFTANDSYATSCHGCMESLPEVERSTFYTS